ncbi:MAG: HD domain-containing protein [Lachnospiraceae bacterium]|nr:HD domain-containing protein [Lachnospiraceae bacterium]MBQ9234704.1 HD domain-containing protein [Lachnospiraceae bacterium]
MNFINELREGENISEVYLCKTKTTATTKAGKTYYSLILQDKSGSVDGKVWELNNGIGHFDNMDYIRVDAQVTSFNNSLQLNIKRIRKADEGEYDPKDYLPCSEKDIEGMYKELLGIVDSISDTHLNKLLKIFFVEDENFIRKFKVHSAAKSVHHGFIGGLLEHSLSVAKLCIYISDNYPAVKRDLLVSAALLHDIGKVDEISDFPENDYTDEGQLIGHIVMGAMMVDEKIKTIEGFPIVLANELKHCILSHHGELEFGSPKKPGLIEALALAHADNLDAKLETFTELINTNTGKKEWLGYNRMFDANVRLTTE